MPASSQMRTARSVGDVREAIRATPRDAPFAAISEETLPEVPPPCPRSSPPCRERFSIIAKTASAGKVRRTFSPSGDLFPGEEAPGRGRWKVIPDPQPEVSVGLSRPGTSPRIRTWAIPESGQTLTTWRSSSLSTRPCIRRNPATRKCRSWGDEMRVASSTPLTCRERGNSRTGACSKAQSRRPSKRRSFLPYFPVFASVSCFISSSHGGADDARRSRGLCRAQISLPLRESIQVQGGKIQNRNLFGGGGRKAGDHLDIAPALVAHLHPFTLPPAFRVKNAEPAGVLVPAINAPDPAMEPVRAARTASQVPGLP